MLRLRKTEAAAEAKVDVLEQQNQVLQGLLASHGIAIPADATSTTYQHTSTAGSAAGLSNFENLHMQDALKAPNTGASTTQQESIQLLRDNGDLAVVPSYFLPPTRLPGTVQATQPATTFNFDDSQAELDFILTSVNPSGRLSASSGSID